MICLVRSLGVLRSRCTWMYGWTPSHCSPCLDFAALLLAEVLALILESVCGAVSLACWQKKTQDMIQYLQYDTISYNMIQCLLLCCQLFLIIIFESILFRSDERLLKVRSGDDLAVNSTKTLAQLNGLSPSLSDWLQSLSLYSHSRCLTIISEG